jgi:hypothetical protein
MGGADRFAPLGAFVLVCALAGAQKAQAETPDPWQSGIAVPVTVAAFTGTDFGPNAVTPYAGVLASLDGNLAASGFLFRALGVHSDYDYHSAVGKVDGRLNLADAMLGYQYVGSSIYLAFYLGVEYQEHDLSPNDPTNPVSGAETGFKIAGTVRIPLPDLFSIEITGNYSTAFDSYWTRARLGYAYTPFVVGPEFIAGGNLNHNEFRVGAFVDYKFPGDRLRLTVSGGYHFNDDSTFFKQNDGGYAAVNLTFDF